MHDMGCWFGFVLRRANKDSHIILCFRSFVFLLGFFFFCVFLIVLTCKVKDNTAIAFANRDTIEQYKAFLYLNRLFCFVLSKCQILPTMHLNHLNKFELEGSSSINCFFLSIPQLIVFFFWSIN